MTSSKRSLIKLIQEAIEMLILCKYRDQAMWFQDRLSVITKNPKSCDEFQKALDEIDEILAGMGSFSDLPLIPDVGSGLTAEQLRQRQWDLVVEIGESIEMLKNKIRTSQSR